jgi:hypothetical protein
MQRRYKMKKLLVLALAFILAACGAPAAPATPTAGPTATPVVVVATVLVTVVPTQEPTQVPTVAPPPTQPPQIIVVTATQPAGAPPPAPAGDGAEGTATATLPAGAGGSLFTNLTRTGSFFSLRCLPQDITFSVTTSNYAVVEVDLYYRIEDLTTQPITYSEWKGAGKMNSDKNGNFTMTFNTAQISPDLRAADRAWFDYQFVGLAKSGDAVGRSGKISQQVYYLKDCP